MGSDAERVGWVVAGWAGGIALGATAAGPAGAFAGAAFGLLAGTVRARTGKTLMQHASVPALAPPRPAPAVSKPPDLGLLPGPTPTVPTTSATTS